MLSALSMPSLSFYRLLLLPTGCVWKEGVCASLLVSRLDEVRFSFDDTSALIWILDFGSEEQGR